MRPRVLHLITHLALGGAERAAFNLINGLRDKYDFAVAAVNGVNEDSVGQSMRAELAQMNVPLYVGTKIPVKFGGLFFAGRCVGKAVRDFHPDIIHAHTEIPEASYATLTTTSPRVKKIPLVRTIQNSIYWEHWPRLGRWVDGKMARSYIACVSQGAKDAALRLRENSGAGNFAAEPRIIYNAVIVNTPPQPMDRAVGNPMKILFAGRFEDQKGADLLPTILRSVELKNDRTCELTIFGSGHYQSLMDDLAKNPPTGWKISVHPPVANLSARMVDYDLLIMPSRYEGLALLAIEAAMLATPCIATDGPGIWEGFPPNYPWLAKAGDADLFAKLLQKAVDDPNQLREWLQPAQDFARQHFDVAGMCGAFDDLYRDVLKGV